MDTWENLKSLGKIPIIAQIGGFRPSDEIKSWFGGNFLLEKTVEWPNDLDGNMLPVIQIHVPQLPNGKEIFGDTELVQVFLNSKSLPQKFHAKNGDGWLLLEYESIEGLSLTRTPDEVNVYKSFQIKWLLSQTRDYPCWEESWEHLDMTEINESEELSDRFFDELDRHARTKIGGYADYIQSPCSQGYEYVFQISSEEKPQFVVGHDGNIYILKSKENGEWYMYWDCY